MGCDGDRGLGGGCEGAGARFHSLKLSPQNCQKCLEFLGSWIQTRPFYIRILEFFLRNHRPPAMPWFAQIFIAQPKTEAGTSRN